MTFKNQHQFLLTVKKINNFSKIEIESDRKNVNYIQQFNRKYLETLNLRILPSQFY